MVLHATPLTWSMRAVTFPKRAVVQNHLQVSHVSDVLMVERYDTTFDCNVGTEATCAAYCSEFII